MTTPEQEYARWGPFAAHLINHLLDAEKTNDPLPVIRIVEQVRSELPPEVLVLIFTGLVKMLATRPAAPMATPEELGVTDPKPTAWHTARLDQIAAANEAGDADTWMQLVRDMFVDAVAGDMQEHRKATGELPDLQTVMRVPMMAEPAVLVALSGVLLREAAIRKLEGG